MKYNLSTWSKVVLWFLAAVVAGAVVLALFILGAYIHNWNHPDFRVLFAALILFFAYWAALNLRYLLAARPLLLIGPEGIEERLSGFGFIPWEDVTGVVANVLHIRGGVYRTLYLRVRNSNHYYGRVRWFVQPFVPLPGLRRDFLEINFSYLSGSMEEALECIRTLRPSISIEQTSRGIQMAF